MKINKKRLIATILDLVVIIGTIILTPKAIAYATAIRGYKGIGGEYLLPILGLIIVMVIESIYEESENKKKKQQSKKSRR